MKAIKGQRYLWRRGDTLYFRRAVPFDVRHEFDGKRELWFSLKTASIPVARSRLQRLVDEFETKVASARGELAPAAIANERYNPTKREIEIIVRAAFKKRIERIRPLNKKDPVEMDAAIHRLEELKLFCRALSGSRGIQGANAPLDVQWQSEALCEKNGWSIRENDPNWWVLTDLVTRAQIEASERQIQFLEGRQSSSLDMAFKPEEFIRDAKDLKDGEVKFGKPVSLVGLFEAYVIERKPEPSTIKSYRAKISALRSFLGHDDARKISKRDVALWKEQLLLKGGAAGKPLNAKTVRATYLSAVKRTLRHGVENGLLVENVAEGVSVAGRKRTAKTRLSGFTDEEAHKILSATLEKQRGSLSEKRRLARRWLPWLCAYTGARVDEMAQLRSEDVAIINDIWTISITPEAGSTKSGDARVVAMHPHLVSQGFAAIAKSSDGPIFYDPSKWRGGSKANRQSQKVGQHIAEWVRKEIGVTDPRIKPNHGWRHRFKTMARECRMMPEIRDYIQGHVPRNQSEGYGDTTPKTTLAEIARLPHYKI